MRYEELLAKFDHLFEKYQSALTEARLLDAIALQGDIISLICAEGEMVRSALERACAQGPLNESDDNVPSEENEV